MALRRTSTMKLKQLKLVLKLLCWLVCHYRKAFSTIFVLLLPTPVFLVTCSATSPLFRTSPEGTLAHLVLPWLAAVGVVFGIAYLTDLEVDCRNIFVELPAYKLANKHIRELVLQNFPLILESFRVKIVVRTTVLDESMAYGDHPSGSSGKRRAELVMPLDVFAKRESTGDFKDTFHSWDCDYGSGSCSVSYSFKDATDWDALDIFIEDLKTCDTAQAREVIQGLRTRLS